MAAAPATVRPPPSPAAKPAPVLAPAPAAAKPKPAEQAASTQSDTLGRLYIAVSPWGEVEVDGRSVGSAPPLTFVDLPAGHHTVTVRNTDFAPQVRHVDITAEQVSTIKFRFGS